MKYCCRAAPEINPVITQHENDVLSDLFKHQIDYNDPKHIHAVSKRYNLNTFFPDAVITLQDILHATHISLDNIHSSTQHQSIQNKYTIVLTDNKQQATTKQTINETVQQHNKQHHLSDQEDKNKSSSLVHLHQNEHLQQAHESSVEWGIRIAQQSQYGQIANTENAMLGEENDSRSSEEQEGITSVVRQSIEADAVTNIQKNRSSNLRKSGYQTETNKIKAEQESNDNITSDKDHQQRLFEEHVTFDNHSTSTGDKDGLQFKDKEVQHASDGDFDKYDQIAPASGIENSVNPIFDDPKVMSTQLQPDIKDDTLSDEKEHIHEDHAFVNDSTYQCSQLYELHAPEPTEVAFMTDFTTPGSQLSGPQNDSKNSIPQSEPKHSTSKKPVSDTTEVDLLQRSHSENYTNQQQPTVQQKLNDEKPPIKPPVLLTLSQSITATQNKTRHIDSEDNQIEFAGQIIGPSTIKSKIAERLLFKRMNNIIIVCKNDGTHIGQIAADSKNIDINTKRHRIVVSLTDGRKIVIKCHDLNDVIKKQHKLYCVIGKIQIINCQSVVYNNIFNQLIIQSNYPIKRINVEGLQIQNHGNIKFSLYRNGALIIILRFHNEEHGKKFYEQLQQLEDVTFLTSE